MKLGLGLYDGMVTADNLRFAKQMSATQSPICRKTACLRPKMAIGLMKICAACKNLSPATG